MHPNDCCNISITLKIPRRADERYRLSSSGEQGAGALGLVDHVPDNQENQPHQNATNPHQSRIPRFRGPEDGLNSVHTSSHRWCPPERLLDGFKNNHILLWPYSPPRCKDSTDYWQKVQSPTSHSVTHVAFRDSPRVYPTSIDEKSRLRSKPERVPRPHNS